ncbi:unnamed protein product, partial [Polarella glacialis]
WFAWGKDCLQNLVMLFETTLEGTVKVRPWPEWFQFKDSEWPHARAGFVALRIDRSANTPGGANPDSAKRIIDLREIVVQIMKTMSAWPEAQTYMNRFDLHIRHVKGEDLKEWKKSQEAGVVITRVGKQLTAEGGTLEAVPEDEGFDDEPADQ